MPRLTNRYETHVASVCENCYKYGDCYDSVDCVEVLQSSLAALEDILYAPDGSERITLDRLRELVAAERDGRAVVLPCKVGSDVYRVVNDAEPHVTKDTVRQISINVHGQFLVLTGDRLLYLSDFGKTVFLTRAEAEAKGEQE